MTSRIEELMKRAEVDVIKGVLIEYNPNNLIEKTNAKNIQEDIQEQYQKVTKDLSINPYKDYEKRVFNLVPNFIESVKLKIKEIKNYFKTVIIFSEHNEQEHRLKLYPIFLTNDPQKIISFLAAWNKIYVSKLKKTMRQYFKNVKIIKVFEYEPRNTNN